MLKQKEEIEVKYLEIDKQDIEKKLNEIGAVRLIYLDESSVEDCFSVMVHSYIYELVKNKNMNYVTPREVRDKYLKFN
jgi:hypothetical protein